MIPTLQILPPDLFPPSIQPLVYFTLLPLALILCGVGFLVFYLLVLPPEAKTYLWNRFKKKDMFDVETESGVRILDTGTIYAGGIVKLDKTKLVFPIPRPIPNQQIRMNMASNGMDMKNVDKVMKKVQEAEKATLKPSIVKGLGCRIYRMFQSTALATTLATLVGLEYNGNSKTSVMAVPLLAETGEKAKLHLKNSKPTKSGINVAGKRVEPAKLFIKKGTEVKEWLVDVLLPVDPNVIRKWFDPQFSPTQADDIQHLGERLERERAGSALKKWLAPIFIIMMIVIVAIIAVVLLSSGGGAPQPTP